MISERQGEGDGKGDTVKRLGAVAHSIGCSEGSCASATIGCTWSLFCMALEGEVAGLAAEVAGLCEVSGGSRLTPSLVRRLVRRAVGAAPLSADARREIGD